MNNRPPSMHDGAQGEPASNGCESTQLNNQFLETVFLIAAGLRKREELFAANPRRYPYCNELRLGIERFAVLHAQHAAGSQALLELLDGLSESSFIRTWCTRDLSTWIEQWTPAAREELGNLECLELGPFAEVGGSFFNITKDCLEFLWINGNGSTDDLHENRVYSMLRDAGQAAYVFGRKFLILHPTLSWEERTAAAHANLAVLEVDRLDQGEMAHVDGTWVQELIDTAYERAPLGLKVCPVCGWTMSLHGLRPMCLDTRCTTRVDADEYENLPDVPPNSYRLRRGVMRFIAKPGALELQIARKVQALGLPFELWPRLDTCDILITLPGGRSIAVDAKDHRDIDRLVSSIECDDMREAMAASEAIYVVPANTPPPRRRVANRRLAHKPGYSIKTPRELTQHLKTEMGDA